MSESAVVSAVPHDGQQQMTVVALHTIRSICNPVPEEHAVREAYFSVGVGMAEVEDVPPMPALVGQVTTGNTNGTHMLGVTAIAVCKPGDAYQVDPSDDEQADAFLEQWGNWGAHLLWDYCHSQLKSIASGLIGSELVVPPVTPQPYFELRRDVAEEDSTE